MNKKMIVINRILFISSVLILAASLVFYLIRWGALPEKVGVHFSADGQFDVFAEKFYGFYPHVVGGAFIAGLAFARRLAATKKTGLRISAEGEKHFKAELSLTLGCVGLLISLFFTLWSRSVSLQIPLDTVLVSALLYLMIGVLFIGGLLQEITYRKYKEHTDNAGKTALFRRMSRLTAWLMTAAEILVLIVAWGRLPSDKELYLDPAYSGLAYFANFDAYLDKRLLLIPPALAIILLTLLELICARAKKADNGALCVLTDRLKLLIGLFFFWWECLLCAESGIGIVSVSLFTLLCLLSLILYFRGSLKTKSSEKTKGERE